MKDFRGLRVWDKAHKLTLHIYSVTTGFPKHELQLLSRDLGFLAEAKYGDLARKLTEIRKI